MPQLFVRFQNQTLGEFSLRPGVNVIGRLPTHRICIENLGISRNHAFILGDIEQKIFVLEDLKSLNGTYVNKKRVHKHLLHHGDVITIGQHALEFVDKPSQSVTASSQSPITASQAYLEALDGGTRYPLNKELLFFGNTPSDDIPVAGMMVGRNFASMTRKGNIWVVSLLVKRFAPLRLNGEDVVSAKLQAGDTLDVAGTQFRFQLD